MENVLHIIFRYFIDIQAGVVSVERLFHKGDANNVLPTAIAYRSVPRYGYCVSCTVPCGVYRDTPAPVYRSGPRFCTPWHGYQKEWCYVFFSISFERHILQLPVRDIYMYIFPSLLLNSLLCVYVHVCTMFAYTSEVCVIYMEWLCCVC